MAESSRNRLLVYTTLASLIIDPTWCPTENAISLTERFLSSLIQTAQNNKLVFLLKHLTKCQSCKRFIPQKYKEEIDRLCYGELVGIMAIKAVQRDIVAALEQKKLDYCLVKNYSLYPKLYSNFLKFSTDVDILISHSDKRTTMSLLSELGYRLHSHFKLKIIESKPVYYEELGFRHKSNLIKIDLRFQAAMPDPEIYPLFTANKVRHLSLKMLKYKNTKDDPLPIEIFLLSQIMHFFSNDLFRGLRHLYEVIYLAYLYKNEINWKRYDSLAKKYNCRLVTAFIFSYAREVFGINFSFPGKPLSVSEHLSLKMAKLMVAPQKIVFFPSISTWPKGKTVAPIGRENMLLRLFLSPESNFYKLSQLVSREDTRIIFIRNAISSNSLRLSYKTPNLYSFYKPSQVKSLAILGLIDQILYCRG